MESKLRWLLEKALSAAKEKGQLPITEIPPIFFEPPKEKEYGDLSTNLAMVLAKKLKIPPNLIAKTLVENISKTNEVFQKVEIAGPGFINFFFTDEFLQESLREILSGSRKGTYKKKKSGPREKILLEFVSANPTGPLNVVNARAAALGDTLARLLTATGCDVAREFYVNDQGSQIENLARSVQARYLELLGHPAAEFPEDWYAGEYVKDLAKKIYEGFGKTRLFVSEGKKIYGKDVFSTLRLGLLQRGFKGSLLEKIPDEKSRLSFLASVAVIYMVHLQRKVLERFQLIFESWFFQSQLGERIKNGIELLKEREHVYEQDGAVWFRTTTFGDDKDRVLVRQDGEPTYFSADIAYHAYKVERGYNKLIDLLGPDHHGYIARTKASMQALGHQADLLEIYLIQLVTLMSGGKPLRMSKRAGEFITMEELLDEVGVDAARWYFLNRHRDSHLEFDLDLAKLQSEENPLYYVQYAHARISSILRMSAEQGVQIPPHQEADLTPLIHEAEKELIKKMGQKDSVIRTAAENREPHHLTRYLFELAKTFHSFYTECRVLGESSQKALTQARLLLVLGCRKVLAEVLDLMAISAPEKM